MIEIIEKKSCTGCNACASVCIKQCITMISDKEGFWYPSVDYTKCVSCKKCINVCPVINKTVIKHKPYAFACQNNNTEVRMKSSSGGMFSLLAEKVINKGGVVFGVGFNDKMQAEHSFVEQYDDIDKFRGSKYVQSWIGNTYLKIEEFLKSGKLVMFTGTPCQVGGLKAYLGHEYDNLLCVDFLCHGVPSPKVLKLYIEFLEKQAKSKVINIHFTNKSKGWRNRGVLVEYENGTEEYRMRHKDKYLSLFLRDITLRPSCYDCAFKTLSRQSDITIADYWGVKMVLPEIDDDKGTSVVFLHSDKGVKLFRTIKSEMLFKSVTCKEAIIKNGVAYRSVKCPPQRESFFEDIDKLKFQKIIDKYAPDKKKTTEESAIGIFGRIKNKIKKIFEKTA